MNWTALLNSSIEETYRVTFSILDLVNDDDLSFKPATGSNWMTTGQLLEHITSACGACCRGFVKGEWDMPGGDGADGGGEGACLEDMSPEEMLPPAEALPTSASVADARAKLESDKALALAMVAEAGEARLASEKLGAPWCPTDERLLGEQLLGMVLHLGSHKAQLFYYLKLQGKPVHTGTLWGM